MKYLFRGVVFCIFFGLLFFITSDQYKMIFIPKDIKESYTIVSDTIGDYKIHTRKISTNTLGGTDKYEYKQYYINHHQNLLELSICHHVPLGKNQLNKFLSDGEIIRLENTIVGVYNVTEEHQEIRWVINNQMYSLRLHNHLSLRESVGKEELILLFEDLWVNR